MRLLQSPKLRRRAPDEGRRLVRGTLLRGFSAEPAIDQRQQFVLVHGAGDADHQPVGGVLASPEAGQGRHIGGAHRRRLA